MGQSLENDTQGFLWTLLLSRAMLPCAMLPHTQIKSKVGESGIGQQHAHPSIGVFSDASTNEWAEFCTLCHHLLHVTGTQRSPKGAIRRSPRPLKNHPHPGLPVTAARHLLPGQALCSHLGKTIVNSSDLQAVQKESQKPDITAFVLHLCFGWRH